MKYVKKKLKWNFIHNMKTLKMWTRINTNNSYGSKLYVTFMVFVFQFCEVGGPVFIDKKIQPNLARDQTKLYMLNIYYELKLIMNEIH
jgi:hypothetical protein